MKKSSSIESLNISAIRQEYLKIISRGKVITYILEKTTQALSFQELGQKRDEILSHSKEQRFLITCPIAYNLKHHC